MFQRLRWRIALPYVLLVLAGTLGLTLYLSDQVRQVRLADLEAQLQAEARLLASSAAPMLQDGTNPRALDELARLWAAALSGRVTIMDATGITLGESHEDRAEMENHLSRPEVQQALKTGQGSSTRFSTTLGYEMMYAAVPIRTGGGRLLGVMRVALPLREIQAHLDRLRQEIAIAGIVTALVVALLAVLIASHTTARVREMTDAAGRLAGGDLSTPIDPITGDEIGELGGALRRISEQLRDRRKLVTVLDHVADGVLLTDASGHIRLINTVAARFLDVAEEAGSGRSIQELALFPQLVELWEACREERQGQAGSVDINRRGVFLQAIVTPFHGAEYEGSLVILRDRTQTRLAEMARRNLISNMANALWAPLEGLRSLAATLRAATHGSPPAALAALNRMDGELDALNNLAEELSELSSIENGPASLRLTATPPVEIVNPLVSRLLLQAQRAGVELTVNVPSALPPVLADAGRARVALTILVRNALRYTPPGGRVSVAASNAATAGVGVGAKVGQAEVLFTVQDTGVGISVEELPGIFEWAYQAESEQSDGIGLGLTIAKQIVQGHGGRIWAESAEGEGCTYYFTLPVAIAG